MRESLGSAELRGGSPKRCPAYAADLNEEHVTAIFAATLFLKIKRVCESIMGLSLAVVLVCRQRD